MSRVRTIFGIFLMSQCTGMVFITADIDPDEAVAQAEVAELRETGEAHYRRKDYRQAADYYSEAIWLAHAKLKGKTDLRDMWRLSQTYRNLGDQSRERVVLGEMVQGSKVRHWGELFSPRDPVLCKELQITADRASDRLGLVTSSSSSMAAGPSFAAFLAAEHASHRRLKPGNHRSEAYVAPAVLVLAIALALAYLWWASGRPQPASVRQMRLRRLTEHAQAMIRRRNAQGMPPRGSRRDEVPSRRVKAS